MWLNQINGQRIARRLRIGSASSRPNCVLWTCVTWHSSSLPRACKDSITTNTDSKAGRKTGLLKGRVRTHTHSRMHTRIYWKSDSATQPEWKHREKNKWAKTTWGEKHPILSGVEICHKRIPDSIVTLSRAISILVNSVVSWLLILRPKHITRREWDTVVCCKTGSGYLSPVIFPF